MDRELNQTEAQSTYMLRILLPILGGLVFAYAGVALVQCVFIHPPPGLVAADTLEGIQWTPPGAIVGFIVGAYSASIWLSRYNMRKERAPDKDPLDRHG